MLLIPIGHNKTISHFPWATLAIGALCVLVQAQHTFIAPSEMDFAITDFRLQAFEHGDTSGLGPHLARGLEIPDDPDARAALRSELQVRRAQLRRADLSLFLGHFYDEGLFTLRLLTAAFAHGGWLHLIGNLLFLWLAGSTLEDRWGRAAYLGFYLGGAMLSEAFPTLLHHGQHVLAVGASGAIAACMGAFIVFWGETQIDFFYLWWFFFRPRWGTFQASAYWALGAWFLLQFVSFFFEAHGATGGVSYSAHVSGFIFGAGCALLAKKLGYDAKLVAATEEPGNWEEDAKVSAALSLAHDGQESSALEKLKALRREQPRNATVQQTLFELGMQHQDREAVEATASDMLVELARRGEGRALVMRVRDLDARFPELPLTDRALAHGARAAFELEENEVGVQLSNRLVRGHPHSALLPGALVEVAKAQLRAGRTEQAHRTLEHVISKFPLDPFAQQARRLLLEGTAGPAAPKSA